MPTMTYVAFLRGINVGGNKKVPMADLKKLMEKAGFKDVKTLLASGNVVFAATGTDTEKIRQTIEKAFTAKFGFSSHVIVRSIDQLQKLAKSDPFKGIKVTPDTRLYVTFLSGKSTSMMKIPYSSPSGDYRILKVSEGDVCSVLIVTPTTRSVDAMAILEKEFGKNITTRNWNTVQKILQA